MFEKIPKKRTTSRTALAHSRIVQALCTVSLRCYRQLEPECQLLRARSSDLCAPVRDALNCLWCGGRGSLDSAVFQLANSLCINFILNNTENVNLSSTVVGRVGCTVYKTSNRDTGFKHY